MYCVCVVCRSHHVCRCEYRCGIFRWVFPVYSKTHTHSFSLSESTLMRRKHVLVSFSWDDACKQGKRYLLCLLSLRTQHIKSRRKRKKKKIWKWLSVPHSVSWWIVCERVVCKCGKAYTHIYLENLVWIIIPLQISVLWINFFVSVEPIKFMIISGMNNEIKKKKFAVKRKRCF